MNDEQSLIDIFQSSEVSHSARLRGHALAQEAREQIVARLVQLSDAADTQEFQCPMKNDWDSFVFHALLKRYGIRPYRYRHQRRSTILVRLSKQFMDELLWPVFIDVSAGLRERFNQITTSLLPAIAPAPFSLTILDHDQSTGQLCEKCQERLLEQSRIDSA